MNRRQFLLGSVVMARRRKNRVKVRAKLKPKPVPGLLPQERPQLLRSFADHEILLELAHRMLALYSVEELEAEAVRRGLR